MDESQRIPLDQFEDFSTCRLAGEQFGRRYEFYVEAFNASLVDACAKMNRAPEPRQLTIARRGRECSGYTVAAQVYGEAEIFSPRTPWGGRIG